MNVRVSVIIPTYDCLDYLPDALASIQMQGLDEIEIIVVDDGSTDGTDRFLAQFSKREPRLRIVQSRGLGPSSARNLALEISRAPLIAFLDADDCWLPGKLKAQAAFHVSHPDISFSFTDYLHQDMHRRSLGTCFQYWRPAFQGNPEGYFMLPDALDTLLACNLVGTSTVMVRMEALRAVGGFRNDLRSAEDWDLWLRLCAEGPVACTPAVEALYLVRPNSISRNAEQRIHAKEVILAPYQNSTDPARRRAVQRAGALINTARAEHARHSGAFWTAARLHFSAWRARPDRRLARAVAADFAGAFGLKPNMSGQ